MDIRSSALGTPPKAVDLRRGRAPEIEIIACVTYDFLLSINVTLQAMRSDPIGFDISKDWVDAAVASCSAQDPSALGILGQYIGDGRPTSLQAGFISLIAECPEPKTIPNFIDWLAATPAAEFAEALLDQDGLSSDWTSLLRQSLAERAVAATTKPGPVALRLLSEFPRETWALVERVLMQVETVRAEVVAALRVWYEAVFAAEEQRISPQLAREAEAMERHRAESSLEDFILREMRGVRWQHSMSVRRYIFAPSVFCRPAIFMHFWRGALTFCAPIKESVEASAETVTFPIPPDAEMLWFFTALGDGTRLRILRLLAEREMYLTELAECLDLKKATIKHHMVRLRAAGLVTLNVRKPMTFYALRPDAPQRAMEWLTSYLFAEP